MSRIDELVAELCPDGVDSVALGEVTFEGRERNTSSRFAEVRSVTNSAGLVRTSDYFENTRTSADTRGYKVVRPGMYVYNPSRVNVGSIAWLNENDPVIVSPMYVVFGLDSARIAPEYLAHYFESHAGKRQLESKTEVGARFRLTYDMLRSVRLPLPPLEVQREIVRVLDLFTTLEAELEAELEARRRQYAHYRDKLTSACSGDDVDTVSLADLAGDGLFCDGDWVESKDQDAAGTIRLTQLADIGVGVFRDRSNRWMRTDQAERLGCTLLKPGDVLIARMPDPLGRACQVPDNIGAAATAVDVAILRSGRADVLPRYVMHVINSTAVNRQILSFQTGGTRQRISRTNLGSVRIPLPPLAEQERIVAILDAFDALVNDLSIGLPAELTARRKQYEHYRDRLLTFKEAAA